MQRLCLAPPPSGQGLLEGARLDQDSHAPGVPSSSGPLGRLLHDGHGTTSPSPGALAAGHPSSQRELQGVPHACSSAQGRGAKGREPGQGAKARDSPFGSQGGSAAGSVSCAITRGAAHLREGAQTPMQRQAGTQVKLHSLLVRCERTWKQCGLLFCSAYSIDTM